MGLEQTLLFDLTYSHFDILDNLFKLGSQNHPGFEIITIYYWSNKLLCVWPFSQYIKAYG